MNNRYIKILLSLFLVVAGISHEALAQQAITIKGRVVDGATKEGIPGVTIVDIKNNKGLGVTDPNGRFTFSTVPDKSVQFRYIGYKVETVKLNPNTTTLSISMDAENKSLKEAIVVGYQKRTKETVSGSVAVIDGKALQDAPVGNIQELLQGKVAGLNIQNNTGAPGFRGTLSIRGISQLEVSGGGDQAYLTTNNPLLVIDNVPVDFDGGISQSMLQPGAATGPLALIPPEDVQSIEIMKDAQATALYGSRGANGVIVVTTKKGNSPTPIIDLNSSIFMNTPPPLRSTIGGNMERLFRIAMIYAGSRDLQEARSRLSGTDNDAQMLTDSLNSFYNNSTNWQALFYQTTLNSNNNLQVSGGDPKLNYKANFAYQMNQGVIKNTGFNKYSLNTQLNMQPTKKLRIGAQLFSALGQKQRGNGGGLTGNGAGNAFTTSLLPGPSKFIGNPQLDGYQNNIDDNNTVNIRAFIDMDYEFLPSFRLVSTTSYDYYTDTRDRFNMGFTNNNQTQLYGFVGRHDELNTRNGVNYTYSSNKSQDKGHNVYASVFSEINIKTDNQHVRDVRNGPSDFYWGPRGYSPRFYPGNVWNDANGINVNGTPVSFNYHAASWAGFLSYNYKTKYSVDLAFRLDGNSAAGVNNPYTQNPSVGFRWNFNKENLMKNLSWLDYGSTRLTYGYNSRPTATILNSLGIYQIGQKPYNNGVPITPSFDVVANPNMEPEKSSQVNFGLDLGLFKSRVEIIYDTYYKHTYNIVRDQRLSSTTGFNKMQVNGGAMVNYGHELAITVRPIISNSPKGVNWTFSVNGAINRGILTKLPGGAQFDRFIDVDNQQSIAYKVGKNPLSNLLYQTNGIYGKNSDVPVDPIRGVRAGVNGRYFQGGDPRWVDVNGNYILDDADYVSMGNIDPLAVGGLNTTISYRYFSLNINASYLYKRDILNNATAFRMNMLRFADKISVDNKPVNIYDYTKIDYWKFLGDIASNPALIGSFDHDNAIQPNRINQSLFMEDGSYFKINQITLAYQFRDLGFMKKLRLRFLRAFFTAYNVAMFSNYSGPNPETVSSLGRDDINGYPNNRSYTIGIGAQF